MKLHDVQGQMSSCTKDDQALHNKFMPKPQNAWLWHLTSLQEAKKLKMLAYR